MTIDWDNTMVWFPDSLLNIDMRDDDARTVRLHQETFCNIGGNEAWFDNFKLQYLRCLWSET